MNILIRAICGNKKCRKSVSITESDQLADIVEITIDCGDQTLEYICPHCNERNKILLGKVDQVKFPPIGGVR